MPTPTTPVPAGAAALTPGPRGADTAALGPGTARAVLADLFGAAPARRCAALDHYAPGEPQWLLAEFGDGRITGACPAGEWRLSSADPHTAGLSAPAPAPDLSDAWRLLGAWVFSPSAQIHIAEAAEDSWLTRDSADLGDLPDWLRPRDRSFLLAGWHSGPRASRDLGGAIPFSIGRELSGTTACHPVSWRDFDIAPAAAACGGAAQEPAAVGSWLSVREYWGEDPATGAVGVVLHRLTGYHAGAKPTPPHRDALDSSADRLDHHLENRRAP
ncbi:hypothetical protein ACFPZ0_02750 [Streptomonospora nanhaiensis]|uniref:Uncharacterized protein n=1 Tax=Streptomonospora nanhaiensis TaxID=1323731 RepID=A0A853BWT3_9ACTN|nr:hypothetical protein [Streptomonospora nanhaiensis]MBV2365589.1 hypothetical protein [Streptomonospora nanhaiensis]MBX9387143.1 hypothetical protein [Streptomonospora nanhaiensis]NYI98917.1 hypothetical protein [Streptomonospora nanhaiensis]